jgi:hypothetical protein
VREIGVECEVIELADLALIGFDWLMGHGEREAHMHLGRDTGSSVVRGV